MANRAVIVSFVSLVSACASAPVAHVPELDLGILWVKHSAEYGAITRQVYQSAEEDLPAFIADPAWRVVPGKADLPPAVILDVDETVVSNVDFQMTFERPFTNRKMYDFFQEHEAIPVPGVVDFVAAARDLGVEVFFITNRPCETIDDDPDPCPQKAWTVEEIRSIGIDTDASRVLLADERDWDRAKVGRRQHVAASHRVIMLFGDDLGDFVPCVRKKLYGPCTEPASRQSRQQYVDDNRDLLGHGWYVLPGPMHGSWTSFID